MDMFYGDIDKKFNLIKKIGSGGTAKVYLASTTENPNQTYAVKVIKSGSSTDSKFFSNEIQMLKQVNHPNLVKLIEGGEGVLTRENGKKSVVQYLVLELIKYGELFDYIFFPQKGFGEEIGKYIFQQLLDGLESCHKQGIVHRDMKTENIMLDEKWIMKIADFGFATKADGKKGNGLLYTALGTASYASPELLQKKPYLGVQSDIFSLGVSLFVLVTGKMPFKHALVDDPYYKELVKLNYDKYWDKLSSKVPPVSHEFQQLFVLLIAYDPNQRPSIEECRSHKWMKDYKPKMDEIDKEFKERTKLVQQKKELERKKEEEELNRPKNNQNNKFTVYKGDDGQEKSEFEFEKTSNTLEIEDFIEEDDFINPYVIRFKNETNPGSLLDFIISKLVNSKIDFKKSEDAYILIVGCQSSTDTENPSDIGGDFLIDNIEAELEIKRQKNDELAIELSRLGGNKYDFHRLFTEIEQVLSK
jgi:serine/threonine protein kinase